MEEEEVEEETREESERISALSDLIPALRDRNPNYQSPINLNIAMMKEINLTELEWHHYEIPPKKIKLTNSGHTVILSAKWFQERPFLTGGPLIGNYVFSQMHFHWGVNDMEGSEHTVDGTQYPVEMHVVHFKSAYLTQETALFEKDGVLVLVYFLKLQSQGNAFLQVLLDYFNSIEKPFTSTKIDTIPLTFFIPQFKNDYFIYWGDIKTSTRSHLIMWLICREPIGISAEQVEFFRSLLDENEDQLLRNFRTIESISSKAVYHVNPSGSKYCTLLPISRDTGEIKDKSKMKRTSEKK